MNRTPRTIRTRAKALTNPTPARVSLCAAGANQTPLVVGKADGLTLVVKEELPDMLTKMKAQGYDIFSFSFKGENWNHETVMKWLADGGYTAPEVVEIEGQGFVATDKSEKDMPEGLIAREITTDDGVTITLVKEETSDVAAEAALETTSDVQPVAKEEAEAEAVKDDVSDADLADNGGMASPDQKEKPKKGKGKKKPPADGTANSGENDGSVGTGTVSMASAEDEKCKTELEVLCERAAAISEERRKGFYDLVAIGSLLQELKAFCTSYSWNAEFDAMFGDDDDDAPLVQSIMDNMKTAAMAMIAAFGEMAQDVVEDMTEEFGSETVKADPVSVEELQPVATETVSEVAKDFDEAAVEEAIEQAVEDEEDEEAEEEADDVAEAEAEKQDDVKTEDAAPAWFSAFAESITKTVGDLAAKVDDVASKQAATEEREKAAPVPAQTQKSAVPESGPFGSVEKRKTDSEFIANLRLRGSLGI